MSTIRSFGISLLLSVISVAAAPAWADERADMARIEQLEALSEQDNDAALNELLLFHKSLPAGASYKVRTEILRRLTGLLYDAGRGKEAEGFAKELAELASRQGDRNMIALAQIAKSFDLVEAGQQSAALAELDRIKDSLGTKPLPEVQLRLAVAYGFIHQLAGKFELALAHWLEALRLCDSLPRRQVMNKIYRLQALSGLYSAMQNPEKALETAEQALALGTQVQAPKTMASLSLNRGSALVELGRMPEALKAYEWALGRAREGKVPPLELSLLVNIADYHLRTHDFVRAEKVSREALELAEKIDDKANFFTSKANIGFALGGQGKLAQAMVPIKESLDYYRALKSQVDIEALLGEYSQMLERAGLYKEALVAVREQQQISAELFRTDRARTVASLQEQFDADKRKKEIALLERENRLKDVEIANHHLRQIAATLGAVLALIIGVFVYMLYRRVKKANADLEAANKQLEFHSVRDPLTGLYNRRSFHELMATRPARVERERRENSQQQPDCLLLLDIDYFKSINDTHGHAAGDVVLIEVARRLREAVRDTDMVMRWGGEEFLIFSPRTQVSQLTALVERVLEQIGGTPITLPSSKAITVTVSGGFISVPFPEQGPLQFEWEKAMQLADMALYLGKIHGRNRAYGLDRLLVPAEQALPVLEHDLSAAMAAGMVQMIEVHGPQKAVVAPESRFAADAA
ncbi:tetratricopeptide repeat-containing diguanylate cyclase [Paucibacter sp. APW11]|uniref:diguanylate cyclase n=1 Tax=Roseateles aquae TaxID=3077235 RepID=A0ABU3PHD4_9BURK|nr:tetratricopeptide repeat-containing diguanylate cyclase [Paucibacter sp. APW11]MDT9001782.1 tetratricopeptide repeat-containing diguanylate cyclase [Paucibacter sp. APW11]